MRWTLLALLIAGTFLTSPASVRAADENNEGGDRLENKEDPRQTFVNLEKAVYQDFKNKDYAAAAKKCEQQIELFPQQSGPYYNLACALALQDKKEAALTALEKSVELGYNDADHLKSDSDLNSLHEDKKFAELSKKAAANGEKNPPGYEKGADIKGVKSIEEKPEGGLRYRLRLGEEASKDKPHRLVLWLHPSGGSMNAQIEGQMAADLAKHGYALLVVTQKQWAGWNGQEAEALLNKTLPAAMKQEGVAQEKPILMGFSAGGQLALQLWEQNPTGFAGMILDAAYPLDMQAYMRGQQKAMQLPQDEGIQKVPIYSLVGTADPGSNLWKQLEPKWREAGLPLTVEYIENGRHQWLVGKGQQKKLMAWLDDIAAGKCPGALTAEERAALKAKAAEAPSAAKPETQPEADSAPKKDAPSRPAGGADDGLNLGDQQY